MKRFLLTALMVCAACGDREAANEQPAQADSLAADSMAAAAPAADSGNAMRPGTRIDPLRLKVGDRAAGLQVVANNVTAAPASLAGVTGSLKFKGEVELAGSYRSHYEYPEIKEPCFWVDPGEWQKLPRAQNDQRLIWFCFTNQQEAIAQLGALGTETRATIVIDDYTTNLQQSDVWDQARLVRVVRKEKLP